MKKRLGLAVTCVVVAGSLIGASSAAAAAEFGDACVANEATSAPVTLFEFSAPGNPLPTAAPVSGILTRWSVNLVPEAPPSIPTCGVRKPDRGRGGARLRLVAVVPRRRSCGAFARLCVW
jgi:hypothetical protein